MVEQIYYSNWSQKLKEGHEDYWNIINTIASWIGAKLMENYGGYTLKTIGQQISTINVEDTKEKYGEVRVYMTFANNELIQRKWEKEGNKGEPTETFIQECLLDDQQRYRWTYLEARMLFPQFWRAIRYGADWPELICENKEEFNILAKKNKWGKERTKDACKVCGWDE